MQMFFFRRGAMQQIKICYLFLHADGSMSATEKAHFNEILSKKNLLGSEMEEFNSFRSEVSQKLSTGSAQAVISEVEKVLGEKGGLSLFSGTLDRHKTKQAETIWTLINLGYADDEYSQEEKKVVDYLVGRWGMDPNLIAELNDTDDTILALTIQKNWVQTTSKTQEEIDKITREIERDISTLFSNVEITISEADIEEE